MKWVDGKSPVRELTPPLLVMFDYLINNTDRHSGNWLIKENGEVWAIDNAMSFNTKTYRSFDYDDTKLPNKVKRNMRTIIKDSKEFSKQLNCLLDEDQIIALIERMKEILKILSKKGGKHG